MNKWLADRMLKVFSSHLHPVTVTHIDTPVDGLKRVRFEGSLNGAEYKPGNVIEFRITDEEFRHYTPAHLDLEQGFCDVLFYIHGLGVGSQWVDALTVGTETHLMGPGDKMSYETNNTSHVFFGDETSLGFAQAMTSAAHLTNDRTQTILELDSDHKHWPEAIGLTGNLQVIDKDTLDQKLPRLDLTEATSSSIYYLTGCAKSIQQFKQFLKAQGVARKQVKTMPYWAEGKHGL
ncbi:MAG: SIP domain-containing protein [Pseudomonadota bacterium]